MAHLGALYSFGKALEDGQATSEGGRVAHMWRWTSQSLGPFTDIPLALSQPSYTD